MTDLLKDIPYGCRMLLKSPGFTLVAVVSLALGIGFNTTIFSAVDAVLLRPKAGIDPSRLVEIYLGDSSGYAYGVSSYPDLREYRERSDAFSAIAANQSALVLYRAGADTTTSEYLMGEIVSGNFFDLVGISPSLGRFLRADDDVEPGGHPVVVVSHAFWQGRLGGRLDALGETVDLNGHSFTLVGVAPPDFAGNFPGLLSNFWVPSAMVDQMNPSLTGSRLLRRTSRSLFVKARLKAGTTLEQAQAQMDAVAIQLQEEFPDANRDRSITLLPSTDVRLHPMIDQALVPVATVLMVVVGLVLLIACANVANMLLARASARRGEVAIRLALGSTRWRLIRQLLTESLLLSSLGGALGLVIAYWSTRLILAFKPPIPIPIALDLTLNPRVLFFTLAASIVTGIVFGLAPALQSSRASLVPALASDRAASAGGRRFRLRSALVVLQVAVSLLLLVSAALMLRSLGNAQAIDPGFETENVVLMSTHLGLHGYDEARAKVFFEQAAERLASLPELAAASVTSKVPLGTNVSTRTAAPEGEEPERDADWPALDATTVAPGYFELMRIPLIAGRDFRASDDADAPRVVLLSETAARRFWPGESPIGKRVVARGAERRILEVVGIVADHKVRTLGEEARPQVYYSFAQDYSPMMYLVASTTVRPELALAAAKRELLAMDGNLAFFESKTMAQNLEIPLFPVRMGATLLGLFGALALALASIGIYGVIAYSVSRRTREIGIRMALGASRRDVMTMVTRQSLTLVLAGCAAGLAASVLGTRVLANVLYGVASTDAITFAGTLIVLLTVAFVANWIPARRAARVKPTVALRYE